MDADSAPHSAADDSRTSRVDMQVPETAADAHHQPQQFRGEPGEDTEPEAQPAVEDGGCRNRDGGMAADPDVTTASDALVDVPSVQDLTSHPADEKFPVVPTLEDAQMPSGEDDQSTHFGETRQSVGGVVEPDPAEEPTEEPREEPTDEPAAEPASQTSAVAQGTNPPDTYTSRPMNLSTGLIRALDFLADPNGSTYDEIVTCLEKNKWHDFSNCQTPRASVRSRAYVLISKAREVLGDHRVRPLAAYRKADEATNRLKLGTLTAGQWRAIGIDPPPRWGTIWPNGSKEADGKEFSVSPARPDQFPEGADPGDPDSGHSADSIATALPSTAQDPRPRAAKRIKVDSDATPRRSSRVREKDSARPGEGHNESDPGMTGTPSGSAAQPLTATGRKRGRPRKNPTDAAKQDLACLASRVRENRRPLKRVSYFEGDDDDEGFDDEEWTKSGFGPGWMAEEDENAPQGDQTAQQEHGKRSQQQRTQPTHASRLEEIPEWQQDAQSRRLLCQPGKPRSYHELMELSERVVTAPIDGLVPSPDGSESGASAEKSVDRHLELYLATRLLEARTRRIEEEARMIEAETKLVQLRMKLAKLRGETRSEE